jgi:hypothetical protein
VAILKLDLASSVSNRLRVAFKETPECIANVLHQVKAISDLHSIRGANIRAFPVDIAAISADDFNAIVLLQPFRHRIRITKWATAFKVANQRAVPQPLAECPVIHADGARTT